MCMRSECLRQEPGLQKYRTSNHIRHHDFEGVSSARTAQGQLGSEENYAKGTIWLFGPIFALSHEG